MTRKSAFTLIELSIVLIIIGLLVGGVLAGRDLIKQAQISSIVRDVESYKTALNVFQLKYGGLPGDIDNASEYWPDCAETATDCDGDGDGRIDSWSETKAVFQQLSLAGLVDGSFVGTDASATIGFETVPLAPLNGIYSIVHASGYWNVPTLPGSSICFQEAVDDVDPCGPGETTLLSASDAFTLDSKIDDGSAETGKLLASNCTVSELTFEEWGNDEEDYTFDLTSTSGCGLLFAM